MMDWILPFVFAGVFFGWNHWRRSGLDKEFDRNEKIDPPETNQLKWDMRHIREDINLLCNLMLFAVLLLAIIAYRLAK